MDYVQTYIHESFAPYAWKVVDMDELTVLEAIGLKNVVVVEFVIDGVPHYLNLTTSYTQLNQDNVKVPEIQLNDMSLLEENYEFDKVKAVEFFDVWSHGYHAELGSLDVKDISLPNSERLKDIVVTRDDVDMSRVFERGIPIVNGMLHDGFAANENYYIRDGGKTESRGKSNQLGFLLFPNTNPIIKHRIEDGNLAGIGSLYEELYITASVIEDGYIPMLSVLGRLIPLGTGFGSLSGSSYRVNLKDLPYLEWLAYNGHLLFPELDVDDVQLLDILTSNDFIRKVILHTTCMIIYVKADDLRTRRIPVSRSTIRGSYFVSHQPTLPIISKQGSFLEYMYNESPNGWIINVQDDQERNFHFLRQNKTVPTQYLTSTDPNNVDYGVDYLGIYLT